MDQLQQNILLYFTSAAAQVWAALMVFHILLSRDLKAQADKELDQLWEEAKSWWSPLMEKLRDRNAGSLGMRLPEFGLDLHQDVYRADTDRKVFMTLILAIKEKRIVAIGGAAIVRGQNLNPDAWQGKFDPIAERVSQLTTGQQNPTLAFYAGVAAIAFNLLILAMLKYFYSISVPEGILIASLGVVNASIAIFFSLQVRKSLKSV